MKRSLSTLALMAAITTAASLALPTPVAAHHRGHFGHHFGHGYGARGYGHGYGAFRCSCGTVRIELAQTELRGQAQVLVDGAHAGVVDDFDGIFQRLRLPAGEYEVQVAANGYRTFRRRVLVGRGRTYTLRASLEPAHADGRDAAEGDVIPSNQNRPGVAPYGARRDDFAETSYGSVRIQVGPSEARAQVFVDGAHVGVVDEFDGRFQRLTLPSGPHEIEISLDGHRTFRQTIYVRPDQTTRVQHELAPLS